MQQEYELKKQPIGMFGRLMSMAPFSKFNTKAPVVAVLRLQGVIASSGGLKSGLNLDSLNESIEQAFELSRLQAVAVVINSPGGSPVQSELIYKRIRQLAEQKSIPVISFTEDVAASGGYWLACVGDEIFVSENSIIGSIGVIAAGFGFNELIKKWGVERRIYTQGKNKSILDPFMPEKETDINLIKHIQKDIHESFKNLVKTRRDGKLKADDDKIFNGEFWTGKEAVELGLADSVGDLYSVMTERFGQDVKFKKVGKNRSWLRSKLGLNLSMSDAADRFIDRAIEKISWQHFGL